MAIPDRNRGENPFPTEFAIPQTRITVAELEEEFKSSETRVITSPDGNPVELYTVDGTLVRAEAFVFRKIEGINGTYMDPEALFELLEPVDVTSQEARCLLLGENEPRPEPLVRLATSNRLVQVNVFAGAMCEEAMIISEIGDRAIAEGRGFTVNERSQYQTALYPVYRSISQRPMDETRRVLCVGTDARVLHDIEDCAATCFTLSATPDLAEDLANNGKHEGFGARRIEVAVATTQSLALLAMHAIQNNTPTEMNVGYAAFGLSKGIGPKLDHKNYITGAPIPGIQASRRIFVVGDMGDAGEGVKGLPWSDLRSDPQQLTYSKNMDADGANELVIAYSRGGHLAYAMARCAQSEVGRDMVVPMVMVQAGRCDVGKHGFGVAFNALGPLRDFLKR